MKYGDFKKSWNKLSPTEDITHNSNIARAFGCAWDIKLASRIIVSDFQLSDADDIVWKSSMNIFTNDKSDFFEAKAENSVPRFLTWNANPRIQERVPAWVSFDGTITLIEDDMPQTKISIEQLEKILSEGIEMITMTYLWWWGSRWNGKVSFILLWTE
jgi:CRISPR-associated protein Csm3